MKSKILKEIYNLKITGRNILFTIIKIKIYSKIGSKHDN